MQQLRTTGTKPNGNTSVKLVNFYLVVVNCVGGGGWAHHSGGGMWCVLGGGVARGRGEGERLYLCSLCFSISCY